MRTDKPISIDAFDVAVSADIPFAVHFAINISSLIDTTEQVPDLTNPFDGFVAYYPVPAIATLVCTVDSKAGELTVSAPLVFEIYLHAHAFNPERGFFTNPQDTFSLNEGFITGHNYSDQSSLKTVVDTVTSPVRAIMPSVTVTTQTQVQTGGGKPDQSTTTTTTQSAPPKS